MPRQRKPTTILDLTGRLKHDKKRYQGRKDEPVVNGPLGGPPDRLDPNQRAIWLEIQGELVEGVALASDRQSFELLVRLVDRCRRNDLDGAGLAMMGRLFVAFGMTPADRSRVSAPKPPSEENPFGALG